MLINFISSKDSVEIRNMQTKSDITEIMTGSETNDNIEELWECLSQKYQEGLEKSLRGSEVIYYIITCKKQV